MPGLGGNADKNCREHLAQFVASEFDVAVASVNYHCISNRPQTGATYFIDEIDKIIIKNRCKEIGIETAGEIDGGTLLGLDDEIGRQKSKRYLAG